MKYRKGTLADPVRPKGAGRKRQAIPKVHRQGIMYRNSSDERLLWQRGR